MFLIQIFAVVKIEHFARKLFVEKPRTVREDEVDMVYLDRIHDFLGSESSNLRMASVICFLYLYSIILDEELVSSDWLISASDWLIFSGWDGDQGGE